MAKIHILGAGALGCLFAVSLHRAGHHPCLITRQPQQAEQLKAAGVQCDGKVYHLDVIALQETSTNTIECLLLCTKAYDSLYALESIEHALSPHAQIICLQNGIGQQQGIANRFPTASIYAALCTEGVTRLDFGDIIHAGVGSTTIGHLFGPKAILPEALFDHTLDVVQVKNIAPAMWRKVAINGVINGLTVQHNCLNGELITQPDVYTQVMALTQEIATLLSAKGYNDIARHLADDVIQVCEATANNTSSMLQDHRAGRQTEHDYVYGTLLREADVYQLDVPLLNELHQQLIRREPQ